MKIFFKDVNRNDIFNLDEITITPSIGDIIEIFDNDNSKCVNFIVKNKRIRYSECKENKFQELEVIYILEQL